MIKQQFALTTDRIAGGLVDGDRDLVHDNGHHEQKVESKRPDEEEFEASEVAAGDGMLFSVGELIVFEGG
jgi:hypothetical protein